MVDFLVQQFLQQRWAGPLVNCASSRRRLSSRLALIIFPPAMLFLIGGSRGFVVFPKAILLPFAPAALGERIAQLDARHVVGKFALFPVAAFIVVEHKPARARSGGIPVAAVVSFVCSGIPLWFGIGSAARSSSSSSGSGGRR